MDNMNVLENTLEGTEPCTISIDTPKIKNGSRLTIGEQTHCLTVINVDQHFSKFQKKMWKFLLGIKVEDYSEE